jgi:spore maturation protein CgeB
MAKHGRRRRASRCGRAVKLVIFGLAVSSAWGNGHATLWRGLCWALRRKGHQVVFFERDTPYYSAHRDPVEVCGCDLRLYPQWDLARPMAKRELDDADAAMVTSYCPDGAAAAELLFSSTVPVTAFYDLDAPVTLAAVRAGKDVPYLPVEGLRHFDTVLSYTGGTALRDLALLLGARRVAPLYGCVDPNVHAPCPTPDLPHADLSYLGTYALDRHTSFETLFLAPARQRPNARFALAGAQYPEDLVLPPNVTHSAHVAPGQHANFYCSSALTLNITREAMKECGFCPSARLFEAAACGVPVVTDSWPGLELFFEPEREILVARDTDGVLAALSLSPSVCVRMAERARGRVLLEHTADRRADQLLELLFASPRTTTKIAHLEGAASS